MKSIIEKAREQFFKMVDNFGSDPFHLLPHVPETEKWAEYMLKKYPSADKEVVLLAVWLHDIGHYPPQKKIDHAIRSEKMAKEFLEKENYPQEKLIRVLHCIRAHRCNDVLPESIEAKIVSFIDSASHMTETMYFNVAQSDKAENVKFRVYDKMERDFRDLSYFPEIKKEMEELFHAWKNLIKAYEKINLK